MLSNDFFYHQSVRKNIIAFGSLFNDIHIVRDNGNPADLQTIKVPLHYGPREKYIQRLEQDPDAGIPGQENQVQMVVPIMSFQATGFSFDDSRKLITVGRHAHIVQNDTSTLSGQYNPVPWNINFELVILIKNVEDGLMILEQIVPFFAPDYTVNVKDIPELELVKDIPIVLTGFSGEDNYDGAWTDKRIIQWTLSFTSKAYLYPPVSRIKVTNVATIDFRVNEFVYHTEMTTPLPDDADANTIIDGKTTT